MRLSLRKKEKKFLPPGAVETFLRIRNLHLRQQRSIPVGTHRRTKTGQGQGQGQGIERQDCL